MFSVAMPPAACAGRIGKAARRTDHERRTRDQYNYVWKTEKAWVNTCRQLVCEVKRQQRP
jgi:hypothetical protein